ncbi:hypothetical protein F2P81_002708 [Scophthalmus maximus]|uniref:Uncharacterized protein n=1 Tax=Scophthalmus maximus TaxID=52904 RepID=A0A6A4TMW6_SCOMX|nr:hypothetical protein F2P81_002708 [Scophthalmus maximus]
MPTVSLAHRRLLRDCCSVLDHQTPGVDDFLCCRYVVIAMEALEQLLLACHCQSINLLVESFLSTLRLLLEADRPHLHILATSSVRSTHTQTKTCFL